jgi:hypothetical protein
VQILPPQKWHGHSGGIFFYFYFLQIFIILFCLKDANAKPAEKEEGTSGTAMAPDEKKEEGIQEKEVK